MVQVNTRVAPDLYAKVKKLAARESTTVSAIVTAALAAYTTGENTK
jgi:predicted transcriptional regulator